MSENDNFSNKESRYLTTPLRHPNFGHQRGVERDEIFDQKGLFSQKKREISAFAGMTTMVFCYLWRHYGNSL